MKSVGATAFYTSRRTPIIIIAQKTPDREVTVSQLDSGLYNNTGQKWARVLSQTTRTEDMCRSDAAVLEKYL